MQSRVLNEAKDPRDHAAISDPGREFSRVREAISVVFYQPSPDSFLDFDIVLDERGLGLDFLWPFVFCLP